MKAQNIFLVSLALFLTFFFETLAYCNIVNYGNIQTRVVIYMKGGQSSSAMLNPSEEIPLPEDAVKVKVDSLTYGRGDEEINVWIYLPNGNHGEIHEFGGVYHIPGGGDRRDFGN